MLKFLIFIPEYIKLYLNWIPQRWLSFHFFILRNLFCLFNYNYNYCNWNRIQFLFWMRNIEWISISYLHHKNIVYNNKTHSKSDCMIVVVPICIYQEKPCCKWLLSRFWQCLILNKTHNSFYRVIRKGYSRAGEKKVRQIT